MKKYLFLVLGLFILSGCVTTTQDITSCPPEDAILLFNIPGIGPTPGGVPKGSLDDEDNWWTQEEWDELMEQNKRKGSI